MLMNVGAAEAIKQHDYQARDWFSSSAPFPFRSDELFKFVFFAFFRFWIRHEKPDKCHRSASCEINLGLRRSLSHEV
jgi:hypothetical protein